LTYSDRRQ